MSTQEKTRWSLLGLRWTVFLVMAVWTVDKVVRPEHGAAVFKSFYGLGGLGAAAMWGLAAAEALLLLGFLLGLARRWTYGAVLLLHAVSTLSSYRQYSAPFEGPNLLFFAAWPMLAACVALYLLRDEDTLATLRSARRSG